MQQDRDRIVQLTIEMERLLKLRCYRSAEHRAREIRKLKSKLKY